MDGIKEYEERVLKLQEQLEKGRIHIAENLHGNFKRTLGVRLDRPDLSRLGILPIQKFLGPHLVEVSNRLLSQLSF